MNALIVAAILSLPAVQADTSYLYRTLLVRAGPGSLLDVIEMFNSRAEVYEASGDGAPFIMRHSQGDHWDLLLLFPMGSFSDYYSAERVARREQAAARSGMSDAEFQRQLNRHVAWREELFVRGPGWDMVSAKADGGSYYHAEMFIALPGKRDELFKQREMENTYLDQVGRPQNLIFTRVAGAAWDSYTLGVYRDLKHYAESADIPQELQQQAALAAGFEGADRIGTYMRTLIQRHNDTLGGRGR
ncbi:MAG: hypothetical protein AMS18_05710 [Gemmatimonas sp. SG8_17]|nr:MAG: hypothetical protein AMS18_05710 [Gemmatimonas sp. SG8_17]